MKFKSSSDQRHRFSSEIISYAVGRYHRFCLSFREVEELLAERGITVCGTSSYGNPTTGITFGLMIELTCRIGWENNRMKTGHPWQVTLGADIEGQTIGILGLGKLGTRVAGVAKAFGMKPIAWSQNLTPEKCAAVGVEYVSKEDLFRRADFVTIHVQLSDRTRGLITAKELGLMKKTAYIINTSRGPIIDEKALIAALNSKSIGGAGLDVLPAEPADANHPLIAAWIKGEPWIEGQIGRAHV